MERTHNSSRRLLWAGVGVIVIILLVVFITIFILMGTKKDTTIPVASSVNTTTKVATKDEVKQDLAKVDASLRQFTANQVDAKAAQKDNANQIKVGN